MDFFVAQLYQMLLDLRISQFLLQIEQEHLFGEIMSVSLNFVAEKIHMVFEVSFACLAAQCQVNKMVQYAQEVSLTLISPSQRLGSGETTFQMHQCVIHFEQHEHYLVALDAQSSLLASHLRLA